MHKKHNWWLTETLRLAQRHSSSLEHFPTFVILRDVDGCETPIQGTVGSGTSLSTTKSSSSGRTLAGLTCIVRIIRPPHLWQKVRLCDSWVRVHPVEYVSLFRWGFKCWRGLSHKIPFSSSTWDAMLGPHKSPSATHLISTNWTCTSALLWFICYVHSTTTKQTICTLTTSNIWNIFSFSWTQELVNGIFLYFHHWWMTNVICIQAPVYAPLFPILIMLCQLLDDMMLLLSSISKNLSHESYFNCQCLIVWNNHYLRFSSECVIKLQLSLWERHKLSSADWLRICQWVS
jgi:hypothetical protein